MDVGQHPRKVLHSPDALGPSRSEDLRKRIDPGRSVADVVDGDAGVVGFLDRVRGIGPGATAFVALVGDQAVTDHDEQAALGRLGLKTARQMAQRGAEPGVSAGDQSEAARWHETTLLEVLETTDFDAVASVAGEHE